MQTNYIQYTATVTKHPDGRTTIVLDNTVGFDFRDKDLKQYGIQNVKTGDKVLVRGRYGDDLLQLAAGNALVDIKPATV